VTCIAKSIPVKIAFCLQNTASRIAAPPGNLIHAAVFKWIFKTAHDRFG